MYSVLNHSILYTTRDVNLLLFANPAVEITCPHHRPLFYFFPRWRPTSFIHTVPPFSLLDFMHMASSPSAITGNRRKVMKMSTSMLQSIEALYNMEVALRLFFAETRCCRLALKCWVQYSCRSEMVYRDDGV